MFTTGTFLDFAVLWFLIAIFTESSESEESVRDTWIVVFGVGMAGMVSQWILGDSLRLLALPIEGITLYCLVEWSWGTERKITLKICGWYLGTSAVLKLAIYYLTLPG